MESSAYVLEFEKPLRELTKQLDELHQQSIETNVDLAKEVRAIELKIEATRLEIYSHLSPWQKVQIARHPKRPYALDYVHAMCDGFQELHGDRQFKDDQALIGGTAFFNGDAVMMGWCVFVWGREGRVSVRARVVACCALPVGRPLRAAAAGRAAQTPARRRGGAMQQIIIL